MELQELKSKSNITTIIKYYSLKNPFKLNGFYMLCMISTLSYLENLEYLFLNLSIRPAVSTSFILPV